MVNNAAALGLSPKIITMLDPHIFHSQSFFRSQYFNNVQMTPLGTSRGTTKSFETWDLFLSLMKVCNEGLLTIFACSICNSFLDTSRTKKR
jgi:hypothetical protein